MPSAMSSSRFMGALGVTQLAPVRGRFYVGNYEAVQQQLLPTDPIGFTTVTFQGVQSGCEIRIYAADMTELAGVENCVANQVLTWPVYTAGNPNNDVRVLIMGLSWRPKDFIYTSSAGAQNLPIQQEADKWYSNL